MTAKLTRLLLLISALLTLASSCNKDDVITGADAPKIILDGDDSGIYIIKKGETLTITPTFLNASDASISWVLEGETVSTARSWTRFWDEAGEYYVLLSATNSAGSDKVELLIDVREATPPVISLPAAEGGVRIEPGASLLLAPVYKFDDLEPFSVEWTVDGETVSRERSYTFSRSEPGDYRVGVTARNADGATTREFTVSVVAGGGRSVRFLPSLYGAESDVIYTFSGKGVSLAPFVAGFSDPAFRWTVNGEPVPTDGPVLSYTPDAPGRYTVEVLVSERADGAEAPGYAAQTTVECVAATEASRMRPASGSSSMFSDAVYEYLPAPGQFVGEEQELWSASAETARAWASAKLGRRELVSLGSFGGSLTVGFDHSIRAGAGEYDFLIESNAFNADMGASNEPGIVWVMQDVNGNGLPDDGVWYELKGSEYGSADTRRSYCVTYYRPDAQGMDTPWRDCDGKTGTVSYVPAFHTQPLYYPSWVTESSYTLYGVLLRPRNIQTSLGYWSNEPCAWGYADNFGSDTARRSVDGRKGVFTGFRLANAVNADGSPARLEYADFVRVQTAMLAKNGDLGEVSTEVISFVDYSLVR